jgi:hypothetical protein
MVISEPPLADWGTRNTSIKQAPNDSAATTMQNYQSNQRAIVNISIN